MTDKWRPPEGHPLTVERAKALIAGDLGHVYRSILRASCAPIFSYRLGGADWSILHNGTLTLVKTPKRLLGITAAHVLLQYQKDHAASQIRRYLDHVADRFGLRSDIKLGTRVTGAVFDDAASRWTVTTQDGERFEAQFLITAVGCLSTANVPSIPGLESFAGEWYHTGRWPHEGVEFAGRRVGLIGTGSTGIQAAPVIAEQAAHLTVFQRTANYSVPARNGPMDAEFKAWVKTNYQEIHRKARAATNGHPFDVSERSALDVSPEDARRQLR